jgi:hypothetical protein
MLELPMWSCDPHLRRQNRVKAATSEYILRNSHEVHAVGSFESE